MALLRYLHRLFLLNFPTHPLRLSRVTGCFFSALALFPFLLLKKSNWLELINLSKKQWVLGILSGIFLAAHYTLWFESLRFTSVASSSVLVTLQPLFAFVGGYFQFGERLTRRALSGGLLAVAGSVIIGWQDFQISGTALFGDVLALIVAGVITGYFFIGQHLRQQLSLIPYAILGYGSSAIFLLGYSLLRGLTLTGYSALNWLWFIGPALISTILGQTVFNWLIKWMSTSTISMSILGEPIGTCILAYFILGQAITLHQGIGIVVILAGISIFLFKKQRTAQIEIAVKSEQNKEKQE